MRESSRSSAGKKSNIQCVEVLISRSHVRDNRENLFWTLSVYSLENQPVKSDRFLHDSDVFHFMVYDWQRTIRKLLDDQQVPYSIVQHFSPESIHADVTHECTTLHNSEEKFLSAINDLSELSQSSLKPANSSRELLLD